MKAVILAAGYGTRLYPLTEKQAKPLLNIGGKSLIEYIIKKIIEIKEVNEIIIVSNNKFYQNFNEWREKFECVLPLKIIDDGSISDNDKLGAIKDMIFAFEQEDIIDETLVIAGDNLIEFSLKKFYEEFRSKGNNINAVYDIKNKEIVRKRHGVVVLDKNNKIIEFQEKPEEPKTTIKSICCYMFKPEIRELLKEYIQDNNSDATGFFLEWLIKKKDVYAYIFTESVYDIGNIESYKKANELFSK